MPDVQLTLPLETAEALQRQLTAALVAPVEPEAKTETAKTEDEPTVDPVLVREAFVNFARDAGADKALNLLTKYGVERFSNLTHAQLPEIANDLGVSV